MRLWYFIRYNSERSGHFNSPVTDMYRKTYVKINEEVLTENVRQLTAAYSDYQYYFGVVKGNAYGHGMHIVNALISGGVNYLAVSSLEEAVAVREFNSEIPILCLEPISLEYIDEVIKYSVTLTVDSADYFRKLNEMKPNTRVKVHIKLDTGMNRLGIKNKDEVDTVFSVIERHENVFLEGIYTHLATSGVNDPYYDRQLRRFRELTRNIDLALIPIVHIGRSLTLVHHQKPDFINAVRLGICMYGFAQSITPPTGLKKIRRDLRLKLKQISPSILRNDLKLKTAFSLYAGIISVKRVKKGEFVGYGASFTASANMIVATAAIGYFDGISQAMRYVCVNGKRCEIIGEICMDMTLIQVPEGTVIGDVAEFFGDTISVRETAARTGKNAYRVLTGITNRVPRVYGTEEIYY